MLSRSFASKTGIGDRTPRLFRIGWLVRSESFSRIAIRVAGQPPPNSRNQTWFLMGPGRATRPSRPAGSLKRSPGPFPRRSPNRTETVAGRASWPLVCPVSIDHGEPTRRSGGCETWPRGRITGASSTGSPRPDWQARAGWWPGADVPSAGELPRLEPLPSASVFEDSVTEPPAHNDCGCTLVPA